MIHLCAFWIIMVVVGEVYLVQIMYAIVGGPQEIFRRLDGSTARKGWEPLL